MLYHFVIVNYMKLVLEILGVLSLIELLLTTPLLWRWRRVIAGLLVLGVAVTTGIVLGYNLRLWAVLFFVAGLYRIINLLRVIERRRQIEELKKVVWQTSWQLIGLQLVLLGVAALQDQYNFSPQSWLIILAAVQFLAATMLLLSTKRHLSTTRAPETVASYADRDLPTLTVCIPARNETDDLHDCLESLIKSDYPKLEILVLDDCSQERRTPEIIRTFAHDGVRFIAGKMPGDDWLAKNYAYEQLVEAASGDVLLFCGVDARFSSTSLRSLVATLLEKDKAMCSVIPRNAVLKSWHLGALTVQTARYAWEMALPRRLWQRPPVLSTCWLIKRQALKQAGGFEAVKRSISPERYLARQVARQNDDYTFLQAGGPLELHSIKSLSEQHATAVRTRYPQLHRRPELVYILSVAELTILLLPLATLLLGLIYSNWLLALISLVTYIILTTFYCLNSALTYRQFRLNSLFLLPIAATYDIALLNYSMWRYEFDEVIWKERNVCVPVMQVVPHLPKLD